MRIRVACFVALAALSSAAFAEPVISETASGAADAWAPDQPFYSSPEQVAGAEQDELIKEIQSQTGDPPSTYEMIEAARLEADTLGEAVETAYQARLVGASGKDEKELLTNSQVAWQRYEEALCLAEGFGEHSHQCLAGNQLPGARNQAPLGVVEPGRHLRRVSVAASLISQSPSCIAGGDFCLCVAYRER
jgi:uncharacterized protein YecT (DUF1311 family)